MKSQFLDDAIQDDREVRGALVECKSQGEILWYHIPQTSWTDDEVTKQIKDATDWYAKYCIDLTFTEFKVDPKLDKKYKLSMKDLCDAYHATVQQIPPTAAAKQAECDAAQDGVMEIYKRLLKLQDAANPKAKRKASQIIVVLFLDEWFVSTRPDGGGETRTSANAQHDLLIGLSRFDRSSENMLTHELTHALRKEVDFNNNKKCLKTFDKTNKVTVDTFTGWEEHYMQKNADKAMTHVDRTNQFQSYSFSSDLVFTVREYRTVLHAGYVSTSPGCEDKKEPASSTEGR